MKLFGTNIIWIENSSDLARRWMARHGGSEQAAGLTAPEDLVARLNDRVGKVLRYLHMNPGRALTTAREWETGRDPDGTERRLREALKRVGWTYAVLDGPAPKPSLVQVNAGSPNTILLEAPTIEAVRRRFLEAGLDVELTLKDVRNLLLAEELYMVASEKMGLPSGVPGVEEIAPRIFAMQALGWPFSTWTLEFA